MSDTNHAAEAGHAHDEKFYIKIWAVLLVLLFVSIMGPEIGIQIVTLITAFGIAIVKAYLVAKHFMHVNTERPIIWYMMISCLAFMVLFFAAVSPDVMNHEGRRWVNVSAQQEVERAMKAAESGEAAHGEHGGAAPAGEHGEAPAAEGTPAEGGH